MLTSMVVIILSVTTFNNNSYKETNSFNANPEAILTLIDSTISAEDLNIIRNKIINASDINSNVKKILINYLDVRLQSINESKNPDYNSLQSVPTTNNSSQSMGGRTKSLSPIGSNHTSHAPYSPTPQEYDGGVNMQKAAFIAQALLLAGIGATVILYVILVFTNII